MIYTYEAKNTAGQTVTGSLDAADERAAAVRVREMGYYPMRFVPAQGTIRRTALTPETAMPVRQEAEHQRSPQSALGGDWFSRTFIYPLFTGVSLADLAVWYHQMAAMLNAGVTVQRTLEAVMEQSPGNLRAACRSMHAHVIAGGTLSGAMARHPYIFSELQIEFMRTAEQTGGMGDMMKRLAIYLEQDYALRQMVKKETFYPKVVFVLSFLLPNLVVMIMQGAGAYVQQAVMPLVHMIVGGFAIYVAFRYAMQSRTFAFAVDAIKSYIPYFGKTVRLLAIAKFSRALASLYGAGVLLPTAMTISARVSGNMYLAGVIGDAVNSVKAGQTVAEALRRTHVFPPMFISMVNTGEQTGKVDEMLDKVADFYDEEGKLRLHQSVQVLTNAMFLVVAGIVGFIVIRYFMGYMGSVESLMNQN